MRLLETEGLVVILDRDDIPKAIPKPELFERIEYLYHDYDRYEMFKKLMITRGGGLRCRKFIELELLA